MEQTIRRAYLEKLKRIRKQKGVRFKDIEELRRLIEGTSTNSSQ